MEQRLLVARHAWSQRVLLGAMPRAADPCLLALLHPRACPLNPSACARPLQASAQCAAAAWRSSATGHQAQVRACACARMHVCVCACPACPYAHAADMCATCRHSHWSQVQAAHCVGTTAVAVADGIALVRGQARRLPASRTPCVRASRACRGKVACRWCPQCLSLAQRLCCWAWGARRPQQHPLLSMCTCVRAQGLPFGAYAQALVNACVQLAEAAMLQAQVGRRGVGWGGPALVRLARARLRGTLRSPTWLAHACACAPHCPLTRTRCTRAPVLASVDACLVITLAKWRHFGH